MFVVNKNTKKILDCDTNNNQFIVTSSKVITNKKNSHIVRNILNVDIADCEPVMLLNTITCN